MTGGIALALAFTAACAGNGAGPFAEPALVIVAPPLDRPLSDALPPADARPLDPVKAAVFEQINRDRAAAGLGPVAWDEAASRVADAFCNEQIRESTSGHYLTNGVPPYARTAFAGVFGMQFENSVTWKTTATSFDEPVEKLALEGHAEMLGEKPPYDGHRRTILDPDATHVGLGYALERGDFRMAQEFLTRHLAWLRLERVPAVSGVIRIRGEPIPGRRLLFVSIGWEPVPRTLTRAEASGRTSYSYSKTIEAFVREGNVTLKVVGARTSDRIRFGPDREFSLRFAPDRPGLWTLVFHTTLLGEDHPVPGGVASVWVNESDR
jgi:uncharacterized protein YkwD